MTLKHPDNTCLKRFNTMTSDHLACMTHVIGQCESLFLSSTKNKTRARRRDTSVEHKMGRKKKKHRLFAMTTGSFHDGVRFKITSCVCVIVKAFMREGRRAPVHDFSYQLEFKGE